VPLELTVGDALALDPGCISADVPGSSRAPTED
jgi:hypothetical protein